jgi:hypothetical protein
VSKCCLAESIGCDFTGCTFKQAVAQRTAVRIRGQCSDDCQ